MSGPGSSEPDSGFTLRITIAVMSFVMLAIERGSSPPLAIQLPDASAGRYSSAPETLIIDAPSGDIAIAAGGPGATSGTWEVEDAAATGAFDAHATYPVVSPSRATTTTAVMMSTRRRRERRTCGSAGCGS